VAESAVTEPGHPLHSAYVAAQDVITQLRLVTPDG
jgi:hypothetical protein